MIGLVSEWEVRVQVEPRPGSTDESVFAECWSENVYRLHPDQVAGLTVVDLGANVGAFTLWALAHGAASVHAYEPDPGNVAALESNLLLNPWPGCVHRAAVWSETGALRVSVPEHGGEAQAHADPEGGSLVAAVSMLDVIEHTGPIGLLKCDTEGAEYPAMLIEDHSWLTQVARITMETHGPRNGLVNPDAGEPHEQWGQLLALLCEYGSVQIVGRPSVGGMIHWTRY